MNRKDLFAFLYCADARTDEGYRKVLRRRQLFFVGMLVVGLVTCAVAAMAELLEWDIALDSHSLDFFTGVGTGLMFGALVILIRLRRTLGDPELLRKSRIAATDERTMEINRRALAVAGYVLLLAVYLVCIISGLFYPQMLVFLAVLAMVFLLTYVISYCVYNHLM